MKKVFGKKAVTYGVSIAAVLLLAAILIPAPALAQFAGPIVPCGTSINREPCTICHLGVLIINLTKFLMQSIAFPASVLLIAIGGIVIMTAGPSEERVTTGKKILTNTIVGLLIVMLAWLAVDTIIKILTGTIDFSGPPGSLFTNLTVKFGPWNQIDPATCSSNTGL